MKIITASVFLITAHLIAGCAHVPLTSEKMVIISVPAGFRGPILFKVNPANEALPQVQGREYTYFVSSSGIVPVHSMELSNGAQWKNYSVRYPDGISIRSYGYGDKLEPNQTYLFHLGRNHYQGKSLELFMVGTIDERLKLQSRLHMDFQESFAIWAEMSKAR